jgi:hypothetical protein
MAKSEQDLKAEDFYPLLVKLTADEMVRLAYYALRISAELRNSDAAAYQRQQVGTEEFSPGAPDSLAWDAEGWEDCKSNAARSVGTPSALRTSAGRCCC